MADIITLKQLCAELKIDPREARERLRAAARDAKKFPEIAKMHKPSVDPNRNFAHPSLPKHWSLDRRGRLSANLGAGKASCGRGVGKGPMGLYEGDFERVRF